MYAERKEQATRTLKNNLHIVSGTCMFVRLSATACRVMFFPPQEVLPRKKAAPIKILPRFHPPHKNQYVLTHTMVDIRPPDTFFTLFEGLQFSPRGEGTTCKKSLQTKNKSTEADCRVFCTPCIMCRSCSHAARTQGIRGAILFSQEMFEDMSNRVNTQSLLHTQWTTEHMIVDQQIPKQKQTIRAHCEDCFSLIPSIVVKQCQQTDMVSSSCSARTIPVKKEQPLVRGSVKKQLELSCAVFFLSVSVTSYSN